MKYYKINYSTNLEDIGAFPQIQKMSKKYNYDAPNSIYQLSHSVRSFPDFTPDLETLVVDSKSKITDILSVAMLPSNGFLVNSKIRTIFQNVNLPAHKYYDAKVKFKANVIKDYKWAHIISDYTDYVCYKNSEFYIYDYFDDTFISKIKSIDKEELKAIKEKVISENEFETIVAKKIILKKEFYKLEMDLFKISEFDHDFYVSEKLMDLLEHNTITGFEISDSIIKKSS